MKRRLVCLLVLPVILWPQVALAQWTVVGDGFEYRSFTVAGPNNVFVARMDRANINCILDSSIGTGELYEGRETVRDQVTRYEDAINYWNEDWGQRNHVVVAVNGDFFDLSNGVPTGGQIQSGWYCKSFPEFGGWSGMAWKPDRNVFMGGCVAHYRQNRIVRYLNTGATQNFTEINGTRWRTNDYIIYTPHYATNTHTDNNGTEVLVELDQPLLVKPDPDMVTGTVREIRQNLGSTTIPFDHIVLSVNGSNVSTLLANVSVGSRVGISVKIFDFYPQWENPGCSTNTGNSWTRTYSCVGGNFIFLADGVSKYTANPGLTARNPRTAVAYNDTYIFFIVDDGRCVSVGMSMAELADFCINYLGATWGYNLDGGGSSTMVVNGQVMNVPSDNNCTTERAVANGLMMLNVLPKQLSSSFGVGNVVRTNTSASVRLGPGTNYAVLATVPCDTQGTVLGHAMRGIYAKGQYWWKCDFSGTAGWVSEGQLTYFSGDRPPVITQHPADQAVGIGSNAVFTVQATGTGTLSYQWQKSQVNLTNGGPFSGVFTSTLSITGASLAEAGAYRCVVTNAYGSATSNEATLTVRSPDFDGDMAVDLTDFAHLQLCLGAPQFVNFLGCVDADLNYDQQVNTSDVRKFKKCLSGVAVPLTPGCLSLP